MADANPRSIALIGPYGSGKSTLFDSLLRSAGAAPKRSEATRDRPMTTELRLGHCSYLGEAWSILDCPGSVEFSYEVACAIAAVDLAVVVCEPTPTKAAGLSPLLRTLDEQNTPYLVFVNKVDTLDGRIRDTLAALQAFARRPLVLRQVPIREDEAVRGYVDVVSERAYRYRPGQASELIALPDALKDRETEVRSALIEVLADHDDVLLEKIVEDVAPTTDEIWAQLRKDLHDAAITEVLLGAAEREGGVRRLWKALRHDVPPASATADRHGIAPDGEPVAQVFKTVHAGHTGKLSYARVWRGPLRDGGSLNGSRIGGLYRMPAGELNKTGEAQSGELVAMGRLEGVGTGALLGAAPSSALPWPEPPEPVYALAIKTRDRKDDVKLSGALQKLVEEDPALGVRQEAETAETVLHGQGEMHLNAVIEKLARNYGLSVSSHPPRVPFRETIRHAVHQHARLKRQTGGHGQFADVKLDIAPRGRGEGFLFTDRIIGGAVPRQYIPAVGDAAAEATTKGPLGNPVVDVVVTLVDGTFHSVDSSDMAFKTATRLAMTEGLAKADPMLLEPIDHVTVSVPSEYTARAQRLLTGRRGQILGYAQKPGWTGWDEVEALVPEAELHDLIIELRSQTTGLGTFRRSFDHLAEAHGRLAARVAAEAAR